MLHGGEGPSTCKQE
jgi:hypothetical protein